jgi:hypothetical protein
MAENNVTEDWDRTLAVLEAQRKPEKKVKPEDSEEEDYDDSEGIPLALAEKVSVFLKDTGVLLEFLSNPHFCKTITKRERDILDRQLERLYGLTDALDTAIAEAEEAEDDEEEAEE